MTDPTGRRPLPPELDPRRGLAAKPPARHTARRSGALTDPGVQRFTRAVAWVATLASSIVLLGSAGLYAYVSVLDSKITRIGAICVKTCDYSRPTQIGNAENFLLVGTDSRSGDNSSGTLAGLQDGQQGGARSDTTLLVHVSARRDKVSIISFPRDLYVKTPAYTTKSGTQVSAQSAKFNAAYAYGGPTLLVKQIEENTGLRVDHYVEIDFAGFRNMVNALGGVTVCLSVAAYDPGGDGSGGSGFRSSAGVHKLNGDRALQYVRQRHGLPRGDIDRIERQQRFLAAIIRQVKSAGTLLNPVKLNGFLNATVKSVKLGQTSKDDLLTLAEKMRGVGSDKVQFFTVPTNGGHSAGSAGAVLDIDQVAAQRLFQQVHDDVDPTNPAAKPSPSPSKGGASASAAAPALTVPLAAITVSSVQNATATTGLGSRAAKDLRALGVRVDDVRSAATTGATATEVRYGSAKGDSAKTLVAAIPGATAVADPTLPANGLRVLVGSTYAGAKAVAVAGQTAAAPTTAGAAPSTAAGASAPPAASKPNFNAATAQCGP